MMVNLASMPHVLVSGATGSGKSSCINSVITSLLARAAPDQVRLILVDPKRVELGQYNGLPHLLTSVCGRPQEGGQRSVSWAVTRWSGATTCWPRSGCGHHGYNAGFDDGIGSYEADYQFRMAVPSRRARRR